MKIKNLSLGGMAEQLVGTVGNHYGFGGVKDRNPLNVTGLQMQYPTHRKSIMDHVTYEALQDKLYKSSTLFTAYDVSSRELNTMQEERGWYNSGDNFGMNEKMIASILMPRSDTDIDSVQHEYDTIYASLMTRGGEDGLAGGIGSAISTAVFSIADNLMKGIFADEGESLGTPTRSVYKGSGHREKTYTWNITPRRVEDLIAILTIIKTFTLLSYGVSGKSNLTQEFIGEIMALERKMWNEIRGVVGAEGLHNEYKTTLATGLEYLSHVRVMRNPTLWYIRNFVGVESTVSDFFGPANIIRVDVNHNPDGKFNGLAKAPAHSSSMAISVTFREAISHTRNSIYYPTRL